MRNYKKIASVVLSLREILNRIIVLIFSIMFCIVFVNVITRYVFNSPISWSGELARYSFIGIIYTGAVLAMKENSHIGMDFFLEKIPERSRRKIVCIMNICMLAFLAVFIIAGIELVVFNLEAKSVAMHMTMAIPYAMLPIGGIGMFLELLIKLLGIEKDEGEKT